MVAMRTCKTIVAINLKLHSLPSTDSNKSAEGPEVCGANRRAGRLELEPFVVKPCNVILSSFSLLYRCDLNAFVSTSHASTCHQLS